MHGATPALNSPKERDGKRNARQSCANARQLQQNRQISTDSSDSPRTFRKLQMPVLKKAQAAQSEAFGIMVTGLVLLLIFKAVQGFYADRVYEKQYSNWRINPRSTESGRSSRNTVMGVVLAVLIGPLIVYKFTVNASLDLLDEFPEKQVSEAILGENSGTLFSELANWMEARIDAAAIAGGDFFDGIVAGVRGVLDTLTLALNGSPWPVRHARDRSYCLASCRTEGGDIHCRFDGVCRPARLLVGCNGDSRPCRGIGDTVRGHRHSPRHMVRKVETVHTRWRNPFWT